jgi:hypothetical protein
MVACPLEGLVGTPISHTRIFMMVFTQQGLDECVCRDSFCCLWNLGPRLSRIQGHQRSQWPQSPVGCRKLQSQATLTTLDYIMLRQ